MNSNPIPFEKPLFPFAPIVARGIVKFDAARNELHVDYGFGIRFVESLRLPTVELKIPITQIGEAELRRRWFPFLKRRLRITSRSAKSFRHLGTGILDLKIPGRFRKLLRQLVNEVNFRTALATTES